MLQELSRLATRLVHARGLARLLMGTCIDCLHAVFGGMRISTGVQQVVSLTSLRHISYEMLVAGGGVVLEFVFVIKIVYESGIALRRFFAELGTPES